ncbi:NAD(P)H-dependent oxidoreductase [Roseomonas hellenica]|uniref:NAD(P)H-dependent oxidoreductase n=1 Tax=Plastoroseomonas hellenica TaxID=2687306 RepID=A0ABS5EXU2_9PROT|nr:NAD(P)H-dependent oxidoreductase [Plastoroseomonas hellenica]
MPKLLVVCGSLRRASYNRVIAHALPALAPAGVAIEIFEGLGDFPLYDGDVEAAGMPAPATALAARIAAADGVIIVTPEYNYSMPGVLKNGIDWLSRLKPQPLAGKPVAIQTASMGAMGGVRCQHHLRQTLVALEARVLNKPEIMVGQAQNKLSADAITDEPTRGLIAKQLAVFAEFVRKG